MASLARVNALLPSELRIDPSSYIAAFQSKGFSDELLEHVILDRLEARLRTLDRVRTAGLARLRRKGSRPTWTRGTGAGNGPRAPPSSFTRRIVFAEGGGQARPRVGRDVGRQALQRGSDGGPRGVFRVRSAGGALPRLR